MRRGPLKASGFWSVIVIGGLAIVLGYAIGTISSPCSPVRSIDGLPKFKSQIQTLAPTPEEKGAAN